LIALRALFNAAEGDFELILVDDCSPDGGRVRELFLQTRDERPNTKVFSFTSNREYSGSLNCILSHASGDHVFFVSNDIFVTPYYLSELLATARIDPTIGVVRGCSNFVDNASRLHNVPGPEEATSVGLFDYAEVLHQEFHGQSVPDKVLIGDAFMVTRAVLERVGTFDPLFYGYFADCDFGIRAQAAGFQVRLARGAFAYHLEASNVTSLPEAEAQAKIQRRWARVHENWARFKMKYGLPVELSFGTENFNALPWDRLGAGPMQPRHFIAPSDYSAFLVRN
jgi:GT2 family glycosyltransferase